MCHLGDKVLGTDAVAPDEVDADASSQLLIQVDQPFVVFSRIDIDILANQFGDIFERFVASIFALDHYLVGDDVFATVQQAVFPFFGDGQGIGYQVAFSGLQLADQVLDVSGYFHLQLYTQAFGKLFAQFVLETHVLSAVVEVRRRTVEGEHHQFAAVLDLLQVVHTFFSAVRAVTAAARSDQQTQQHRRQHICQSALPHLPLTIIHLLSIIMNMLLDIHRQDVDGHLVVPAFGHDEVGIALARFDELLVHGL